MATHPTPKEVAARLDELATEIALLKTAMETQAEWVAKYQRREDERNVLWLQKRKEAMRELLVEPSPARHNGNGKNNA
jgi:hypothetical protein